MFYQLKLLFETGKYCPSLMKILPTLVFAKEDYNEPQAQDDMSRFPSLLLTIPIRMTKTSSNCLVKV